MVNFPHEEGDLRELVGRYRTEIASLETLVRLGDKKAYKSLKIVRRRYNELQKALRKELRRVRDDEWRDILEEVLGEQR